MAGVYAATNTAVTITPGGSTAVLSESLPAGDYIINATVLVTNPSSTADFTTCNLTGASLTDWSTGEVEVDNTSVNVSTAAVNGVWSSPSSGTVSLTCSASAGTTTSAQSAGIDAVQVSALS